MIFLLKALLSLVSVLVLNSCMDSDCAPRAGVLFEVNSCNPLLRYPTKFCFQLSISRFLKIPAVPSRHTLCSFSHKLPAPVNQLYSLFETTWQCPKGYIDNGHHFHDFAFQILTFSFWELDTSFLAPHHWLFIISVTVIIKIIIVAYLTFLKKFLHSRASVFKM